MEIIIVVIALIFWKHVLMGIIGAATLGFIGSFFGDAWISIGIIVGFLAGIYEQYSGGQKKQYSKTSSSTGYTSAKENPNLTRYRKRYCSSCGKTSEHEIARISEGSPRAYVTCNSCGHWKEEAW